MKTLLAWIGGISIVFWITSAVWTLTFNRGPVPNERKAEIMALRSFVAFQSYHTNAVFGPTWVVADEGDSWGVLSESGLKVVIEKKTGNSTFEQMAK
jgi:hypothetical protein